MDFTGGPSERGGDAAGASGSGANPVVDRLMTPVRKLVAHGSGVRKPEANEAQDPSAVQGAGLR